MPKKNDRNVQDFSQFDMMSSEELAQILRLDSETPEGNELDIDTLLYITGVLAERKNITETGKTAQEAWKSFRQNYMDSEDGLPEANQVISPKKLRNPWVPRLIAAAAGLVLLVGIPLGVRALSKRRYMVRVENGTLSFVWEGEPVPEAPQAGIAPQEDLALVLTDAGVPSYLVPTWFPDGFLTEGLDVADGSDTRFVSAMYKNGDKVLEILVRFSNTKHSPWMEISDGIVETYIKDDIEYFLAYNNNKTRAAWTRDHYVCTISGDVTIDELKQMIDSIPKG